MAIFKPEELYSENNRTNVKHLFKYSSIFKGKFPLRQADKTSEDKTSLQDLYLEYCFDDPTEYTFATKVFGSWDYWSKIRENTHLRDLIKAWREELNIKRQALGWKTLMEKADSPTVAKFLVENIYEQGAVTKTVRKKTTRKKIIPEAKPKELPDNVKELLREKGVLKNV